MLTSHQCGGGAFTSAKPWKISDRFRECRFSERLPAPQLRCPRLAEVSLYVRTRLAIQLRRAREILRTTGAAHFNFFEEESALVMSVLL